jgi:O-acetyl-ADP-ribose deacetylase (regulator of RNase III)
VIDVRVDDLAFWAGEAIARPVNAELGATTSLLRRLEQAAGPKLAEQLRTQEPLAVGSAVVTGAGALAAELLIHAVIQSAAEPVSEATVRRATMSALHRADAWEIARLAFAPFGLGPGNLEAEESARVMVAEIRRHLAAARHPREVTIVVENDEERDAFAYELSRGTG